MRKLIFLALLIYTTLLVGCSTSVVIESDNRFLLDTFVNIQLYHYSNDPLPNDIFDTTFTVISQDEQLLSSHIDGNDIDFIGKNAGKSAVAIDSFAYNIIKSSITYSKLSNGLFDITSDPLIDLWAINPPTGHVPTPEELTNTLPLINYKDIMLVDEANSVKLENEGMSINLGAIAKGAITDHAKETLISAGVSSGVINAGGNVLLIGSKPDGSDFSIGVQDPDNLRNEYLISIELSDKAVVSSGDYERYFEQDGVRYHHILNPFTGFPADTNIKQVTIIANSAIEADALSTTVLLMGIDKGLQLLNETPNVDGIFITKDNQIIFTNAFPYAITNNDKLMSDYTITQ